MADERPKQDGETLPHGGQAEPAKTLTSPGDCPAVPGYEVLGELGRGGMGVVYQARQTRLDRLVALKVLPSETATDASFFERFTREARALAKLNHANIVTVHDFGQADERWYFVMEYVEGHNLRQRLRAGRVPPEETLSIVAQICDALEYAHDEGIVHRDIKPENILLDRKGRVKIADFGLAKLLVRKTADHTLTGPLQVMGTFRYMAPEQIERPLDVDHRADIYSLGVILYEMLTGELPLGNFALPSQKISVDSKVDAVVLRALAKDPERRYQRASEVKKDLHLLGGDASRAAAPSEMPTAAWQASSQSRDQVIQTRSTAPNEKAVASKQLLVNSLSWAVPFWLVGVSSTLFFPWVAIDLGEPPESLVVYGTQSKLALGVLSVLLVLGVFLFITANVGPFWWHTVVILLAAVSIVAPITLFALIATGRGNLDDVVVFAAFPSLTGHGMPYRHAEPRIGSYIATCAGIGLLLLGIVQVRGLIRRRVNQPGHIPD